jgi:protease-4
VVEQVLSREGDRILTLRQVLKTLDQATKDPKIVGLYLQGGLESGTTGYATLREVRQALEQFRSTGKRILAYDLDWSEREYYLASVANTVMINPLGYLELDGFSSEALFFGNAFDKFGIGVQILRVGKYKSAVEPFTQAQRSPEDRAQTQQLLGDLWGEFRTSVGKSRRLSPESLQTLTNQEGVLLPVLARDRKLVDQIAHPDEVIASLKKLTNNDPKDESFRQISLVDYGQTLKQPDFILSKPKVVVVYAEGEIVDGEGGPGLVGGDRLAEALRSQRLDEEVKAVVLRINSPGGSVSASGVIQREVQLVRKSKPLIVSMGPVAASGGYWIATYANRIFAEPNTITGSIGVFGLLPNIKELANRNGITWDTVKTGTYADSLTLARPKTAAELAQQQKIVDQIYERFLTIVSESRQLPKAKVAEVAQGRVWSGLAAQKIGLVDQLGGLDAAIAAAAEAAKLGKDWIVEDYSQRRSIEQQVLERFFTSSVQSSLPQPNQPIGKVWQQLQTELTLLSRLNDPIGVYARLPYNLNIH